MNRARLLPALALTMGLLLSAVAHAQPPGAIPGQPIPGGRAGPGPDLTLPVVPKSAGAFVTLKVSDLVAHPDLKPVLTQLAKDPEALAGLTEAIGVAPFDIDRVTVFWPRAMVRESDAVLVITTREPYNEARVLKALRARPVYEDDRGHGPARWNHDPGASAPKVSVKVAEHPDIKAVPEPPGKDPLEPKGPGAPPPPKEDDACGSADGGPSDPLFYAPDRSPFAALFLIDDRTLVLLPGGHNAEFAGMALLAATLKKNASGPLADAIAEAGKHTLAAGVGLAPVFQMIDRRTPPELVPYTALFAARTAVLTGSLDKGAKLTLTLKFGDAAAAKRAAPVLEEGIVTVAEKIAALAEEVKETRRPFEKSAAPLLGAFANALKKASVKPADASVIATAEMDAGPAVAKALGELLAGVQSRRRAEQRMNNLKQIGLALHNYHDTMGKFPANVYGPKGELLLSWRVQLLPYLEQDNLYRQFKMDEAWDGPNNKKLIEQMPKVYQAPDRDAPKGVTYYQGFIGPDPRKAPPPKGFFGSPWLREGDKNGVRMADIADGTSNTLAVIEAGRGVTWSKPDDLPFGGVVPQLGEKGWDRTPALRFDGSVFMIPTDLKPERFWPFVTINGGEITEDFEERRPFGARREPNVIAEPASGAREREGAELERVVAEAEALVQREKQVAEVAAVRAEAVAKLVAAGGATAEELAKAKEALASAQAAVKVSEEKLKQCQMDLEAVRRGTGAGKAPRPPK
jgi:hypothetical protein